LMANGLSSRRGWVISMNGGLRHKRGLLPIITLILELGILANYLESTSADPNHGCLCQRFVDIGATQIALVPLRMHQYHKSPNAGDIPDDNTRSNLRLRGGVSSGDLNVSNHANISGSVSESLEGDVGMDDDDSLTDDELMSLGRQCHTSKDFSGAATYFSQLVQRQARTRQFLSVAIFMQTPKCCSQCSQPTNSVRFPSYHRRCRGTENSPSTALRRTCSTEQPSPWRPSRSANAACHACAHRRESTPSSSPARRA
jgi:hypothetical protein